MVLLSQPDKEVVTYTDVTLSVFTCICVYVCTYINTNMCSVAFYSG